MSNKDVKKVLGGRTLLQGIKQGLGHFLPILVQGGLCTSRSGINKGQYCRFRKKIITDHLKRTTQNETLNMQPDRTLVKLNMKPDRILVRLSMLLDRTLVKLINMQPAEHG